jgi:hypothetical protein
VPNESEGVDDAPEVSPRAVRFETRVRAVRANAHAAHDSVEGGGDKAIDAALAVVESEWRACRDERDALAEALKAIRLYAGEAQVRRLAAEALSRRPVAAGWDAGLHITGRDRFPLMDEFDA